MSIRKWLPNVITLALAVLLVITQQVWAGPIAARLASTTTASSKTTINYLGYLTDSSGNPVSGTLAMVFRLYRNEGDPVADAVWTETQNDVAVDDGLFSVLLGSVTGIPIAVIADNSDLWLGIAVGGDEEMSPRERIASSPYAMLATNVADGSITQSKLADNAVNSAKIRDGQVSSNDVGFNYAGSSSKGGAATNVACSNCISSGEIQDGQVTTGDLANGAVNQAKAPSLIQSAIGSGRRIWVGTVTAIADSNGWINKSFSHNLSHVDGGAITPHWNSASWYTAKPPTFGSNYGGIVVGGGLTSGETYTFSVVLVGE